MFESWQYVSADEDDDTDTDEKANDEKDKAEEEEKAGAVTAKAVAVATSSSSSFAGSRRGYSAAASSASSSFTLLSHISLRTVDLVDAMISSEDMSSDKCDDDDDGEEPEMAWDDDDDDDARSSFTFDLSPVEIAAFSTKENGLDEDWQIGDRGGSMMFSVDRFLSSLFLSDGTDENDGSKAESDKKNTMTGDLP
jgi:hypothetical protein